MSLPCNQQLGGVIAAGLAFGAVCMHCADAKALSVCIDTDNPTAAMDLRVASAVAKNRGYELNKVEFEGRGKGDDGLPPSRFGKMAAADCELIMGFPIDVSNPNLPTGVQATSPYASTGFVLVRRANSKEVALADLPKGSEVGIAQLDTYAGLLYGIHSSNARFRCAAATRTTSAANGLPRPRAPTSTMCRRPPAR